MSARIGRRRSTGRLRLRQASAALLLAAGTGAVLPASGRAQAAALSEGARIRVVARGLVASGDGTAVGQGSMIGYLRRADSDTLWLRRDRYSGAFRTVAWSDVARLEVSQGRTPDTWKGALIGTAVGGAAGLALGLSLPDCDPEDWLSFELCAGDGGDRTFVGLLATAIGTGIGALVGSRSRSERWRGVPVPRVRMSLDARGAAAVVAVPVRF